MGRYIVSFIGKEAANAAKASTLSLESLGTCSSSQVERVFNFCLTREAYFSIWGSLDSNSALTCPIISCESLRIERLSAPTASASSRPVIKALYSDSLLEALKPKSIACSIRSPVGKVNCRPMPALDCLEAPSTQRVHLPFSSGQVSGCGISARKSAKTCPSSKVSACTGCHTHSIPLPNGPSFWTYQVYELCPRVADQLAPQRGEPGSMGGAFGRPFGGLKQLI